MNKTVYTLGAALLIFAASCSDHFEPFETNATVQPTEDCRVSYFDIDPLLLILESTDNIAYANLKSGFFNLSSHEVELNRNGNAIRCGIRLQESSTLADGEYLLTFSNRDRKPIKGMLRVTVKDEHIIEIGEAKSTFSLRQGSGTPTDPYIIGSARDFLTLLDDLRDNELTNGREVYFKQTADITLMDQSSLKPGRGYFGYSFAGHYDGGGYSLKDMYYRGAEDAQSDSNIGIFPTLLDDACISNLKLTGANISSVYSDVGILAGSSTGAVRIENVSVHGNITSQSANNIGGLIGRMTDGFLEMDNVDIRVSLVGQDNVGGLIGRIEKSELAEFTDIRTPDPHFSVEGHDCIGGVIGLIADGKVNVTGATMSHVVSREDADVRTIKTNGGSGTGGIIGKVTGNQAQVSLTDITVACPVGGLNRSGYRVGGLIGGIVTQGSLTINAAKVTSIVSGLKEVGGYIGYCAVTDGGYFEVIGDSRDNYVLPDDSAAGIEAKTDAGGVFGYLESKEIHHDQSKIRVAVNVNASSESAGGVIGKANNSVIDLSFYDMTSGTMQVSGGSHIGGMIGYATNSTVKGPETFNFEMTYMNAIVPSEDRFTPLFTGIVKGTYDVGGVIGRGDDVTLIGLSSKCTVTGTSGSGFGGVIGSVYSNSSSHLEDLTSRSLVTAANSPRVGGVIGYLRDNDYTYVTDCINYGEVSGKEDVGGIIGYYYKCGDADTRSETRANTRADYYTQSEIRWCINEGKVSGGECVGGVIGKSNTFTCYEYGVGNVLYTHHCGNHGDITSPSASHAESGVGGIIGYGGGWQKVDACANSGQILSEGPHKGVGGIAGSLGHDSYTYTNNFKNVDVNTCFNSGTIDSRDAKTHVGGILGFMEEGPDSYIRNCANYGRVLNKHNSDNGGILGYVDHLGKIFYCVNVGIVDEGNATIGTHKSGSIFDHDGLYMIDGSGWTWPSATVIKKEDLNNQAKYPKLDFKEIWMMPEEGPTLRDCPFK